MIPGPDWSGLAAHPALQALEALARRRGQTVWLSGGSLRDLLLGLRPQDLDLTADGDALGLAQALAQTLSARYVPLKESLATCRVVGGFGHLDLVGLRAPGILADLALRDFTINALAAPLAGVLAGQPGVLDPTGGQADLAAGRLRLAGPGVLADDPLRVLRAYRFMASHGLAQAPGLAEALAAQAPALAGVAAERLAQEWLKLMAGAQAGRAVRAMAQQGALAVLLPELAQGQGMPQNPFHHLDVLEHNLATLEALEALAEGQGGPPAAQLIAQAQPLLAPERPRALLKTAALLHDLGKPATRQTKAPGWNTFYRHDQVGARLALAALRRLGLAKADAQRVSGWIAGHMRPFHLLGLQQRGQLSPRAVRRLLAAWGPELPGLFLLGLADTMAGRGPERPPEAEERLLALYGQLAHLRDQELAQALAAPPLLDGRQLMAGLGLAPGPQVGRLLARLRLAQLDGRVANAQEALDLARAWLKLPGPPA